MELVQELEKLAQLRATLAEAEKPLLPLREQIEITETAIKEHVSATGEVAEAAGLRVAMGAGAVRYDGHLLFDCVQMMRGTLQTIHADIWQFSGLGKDEAVEALSNTLSGCETRRAGYPDFKHKEREER